MSFTVTQQMLFLPFYQNKIIVLKLPVSNPLYFIFLHTFVLVWFYTEAMYKNRWLEKPLGEYLGGSRFRHTRCNNLELADVKLKWSCQHSLIIEITKYQVVGFEDSTPSAFTIFPIKSTSFTALI